MKYPGKEKRTASHPPVPPRCCPAGTQTTSLLPASPWSSASLEPSALQHLTGLPAETADRRPKSSFPNEREATPFPWLLSLKTPHGQRRSAGCNSGATNSKGVSPLPIPLVTPLKVPRHFPFTPPTHFPRQTVSRQPVSRQTVSTRGLGTSRACFTRER